MVDYIVGSHINCLCNYAKSKRQSENHSLINYAINMAGEQLFKDNAMINREKQECVAGAADGEETNCEPCKITLIAKCFTRKIKKMD